MNSSNRLFVGIDPASVNKDFTFAALDEGLNLVEMNDADMDELLVFLDQQAAVVVAVNAPIRVNQGLVKEKLKADSRQPGRSFRGVDMRLAEYELRKRGISVTGTPAREEYCPAWMQAGFTLYKKLAEHGFEPYQTDGASRQFFETQPQVCFCALAGGIPFMKPTLEGRLQRQIILNNEGLHITDGMDFFEEITRFKLMKGILPTDVLYTPEQLDVLVAAYTAWLAATRPDEVTEVGDKAEGQILLPAKELQGKY